MWHNFRQDFNRDNQDFNRDNQDFNHSIKGSQDLIKICLLNNSLDKLLDYHIINIINEKIIIG